MMICVFPLLNPCKALKSLRVIRTAIALELESPGSMLGPYYISPMKPRPD